MKESSPKELQKSGIIFKIAKRSSSAKLLTSNMSHSPVTASKAIKDKKEGQYSPFKSSINNGKASEKSMKRSANQNQGRGNLSSAVVEQRSKGKEDKLKQIHEPLVSSSVDHSPVLRTVEPVLAEVSKEGSTEGSAEEEGVTDSRLVRRGHRKKQKKMIFSPTHKAGLPRGRRGSGRPPNQPSLPGVAPSQSVIMAAAAARRFQGGMEVLPEDHFWRTICETMRPLTLADEQLLQACIDECAPGFRTFVQSPDAHDDIGSSVGLQTTSPPRSSSSSCSSSSSSSSSGARNAGKRLRPLPSVGLTAALSARNLPPRAALNRGVVPDRVQNTLTDFIQSRGSVDEHIATFIDGRCDSIDWNRALLGVLGETITGRLRREKMWREWQEAPASSSSPSSFCFPAPLLSSLPSSSLSPSSSSPMPSSSASGVSSGAAAVNLSDDAEGSASAKASPPAATVLSPPSSSSATAGVSDAALDRVLGTHAEELTTLCEEANRYLKESWDLVEPILSRAPHEKRMSTVLGPRGRGYEEQWEEEAFIRAQAAEGCNVDHLTHVRDWRELIRGYHDDHDGAYIEWVMGISNRLRRAKSVADYRLCEKLLSAPPVPVSIHHPAAWGLGSRRDPPSTHTTSCWSEHHPACASRTMVLSAALEHRSRSGSGSGKLQQEQFTPVVSPFPDVDELNLLTEYAERTLYAHEACITAMCSNLQRTVSLQRKCENVEMERVALERAVEATFKARLKAKSDSVSSVRWTDTSLSPWTYTFSACERLRKDEEEKEAKRARREIAPDGGASESGVARYPTRIKTHTSELEGIGYTKHKEEAAALLARAQGWPTTGAAGDDQTRCSVPRSVSSSRRSAAAKMVGACAVHHVASGHFLQSLVPGALVLVKVKGTWCVGRVQRLLSMDGMTRAVKVLPVGIPVGSSVWVFVEDGELMPPSKREEADRGYHEIYNKKLKARLVALQHDVVQGVSSVAKEGSQANLIQTERSIDTLLDPEPIIEPTSSPEREHPHSVESDRRKISPQMDMATVEEADAIPEDTSRQELPDKRCDEDEAIDVRYAMSEDVSNPATDQSSEAEMSSSSSRSPQLLSEGTGGHLHRKEKTSRRMCGRGYDEEDGGSHTATSPSTSEQSFTTLSTTSQKKPDGTCTNIDIDVDIDRKMAVEEEGT